MKAPRCLSDRLVVRGMLGSAWSALFLAYLQSIDVDLNEDALDAEGRVFAAKLLTLLHDAGRDGASPANDAETTEMREMLETMVQRLGEP
jgi:hypothetical protein